MKKHLIMAILIAALAVVLWFQTKMILDRINHASEERIESIREHFKIEDR